MRKDEKKYGKYFLKVISSKFGFDYNIAEHDNSKTPTFCDIDVKGISLAGLPNLYLQLVRDEKQDMDFKPLPKGSFVKDEELVCEAIKKKEEKYQKQRKDYSQVVLLIQSSSRDRHEPNDSLCNHNPVCNFSNSGFKGIYYVSSGTDEKFSNGFVRAIKECFNIH